MRHPPLQAAGFPIGGDMFAVTSGTGMGPPCLFYGHDIYYFDAYRYPASLYLGEVAACLDPAAFQLLAISAADFPLPSGSHLLGHTSFPLGHTSPPSGVISRIEVLEYTHSGRGLLALQVREGTAGDRGAGVHTQREGAAGPAGEGGRHGRGV